MAEIIKPLKIRKLDKSVIINVTIKYTKEFRIRLAIAKYLIRVVGWVLDCSVIVKNNSIGG